MYLRWVLESSVPRLCSKFTSNQSLLISYLETTLRINFNKSMNGQRPKKAVNSKIRPNKAIQLMDSYWSGRNIKITPSKARILRSTKPIFLDTINFFFISLISNYELDVKSSAFVLCSNFLRKK